MPPSRSWARQHDRVIRLLVVDDEELVRFGFRLILDAEDDFTVVGEATNGLEAIEEARRLDPDVVLIDVRMPGLDGIEATRRLVEESERKVLILTTFDLDDYLFSAVRAGASGFLLKDVSAEELAGAVRAVARGDALIEPRMTRRLLDEFAQAPSKEPPPPLPKGMEQLTQRELDVFRAVARGLSNAEIAAELYISETTVKTHVAHILTKLGIRDRIQAVVLAYESGILPEE